MQFIKDFFTDILPGTVVIAILLFGLAPIAWALFKWWELFFGGLSCLLTSAT